MCSKPYNETKQHVRLANPTRSLCGMYTGNNPKKYVTTATEANCVGCQLSLKSERRRSKYEPETVIVHNAEKKGHRFLLTCGKAKGFFDRNRRIPVDCKHCLRILEARRKKL